MSNKRLTLDLILSTIDKASAPLKKVRGGSTQTAKALKEAKAQLAGLQRQQKDLSSFQQLQRATKDTRNELAQAAERTKQLKRQIEATENPSKRLTSQFERAGRQVSALREKHIRHLRTLKESKQKLSEAGVDVRQLSQHNLRLSRDIDTATAAMKRQQRELDRLTRRQERMRAAQESFAATQDTAGRIAGAGAGAAAMGGSIAYSAMRVLQPGMEFGQAMSQVQALTRLAKESEDLRLLREQARTLGATTSFTATDAAGGQGFLAMAGFTPQAIRDAMPGMLSLAKAAGQDLATTADIGSNILTGFNLKADQMGRAGDILVGAFTRSNTDLQMLGETMKYVGPVASGLGSSLEEAAAMAGKLGDAGIQGGMAGTALRAIFSRMAAPPKMAADALDELGLKTKDAMGNLRPMTELLTELHERTKDLGAAQRAEIFKKIAGEEAFSGLAVLVGQAGNGELQKLIATLREASGEAQRTAAVMADNASGDLQALMSAAQDVAIEITELNDGPLRDVIQTVTGITRSVGNWMRENPELAATIAKVVVITGALLLGFGAVALAVSALLGPFAILRFMLTASGIYAGGLGAMLLNLGKRVLPIVGNALLWLGRLAMANPIGLAITGIATAGLLIYQYWEPIKAFFTTWWQSVGGTFTGALGDITAKLVNWSPFGILYSVIHQALSALGIDLPAKFSEFGSNLISGLISGITGKLGALKDAVVGTASAASDWFKEKLGIHSPSRVFASHGSDVMAGLQQGLADNKKVLRPVTDISKRITQVGAGIALSGMALGAAALDTRAPLQAGGSAAGGNSVQVGEIHVHAAPGMDEQALARLVAREIQRLQAGQAAAGRSRLTDED
ncbi:phage tail tape measure protein [Marinobacterium sedimentorum]|uniref:phage tail tape measure protein n=1 Tax=Marinobacterium sedimentorum TaxID=2927804 RepID=UPI0020C6EA70|nr:phage tail tape measure protein [Marinobacterium sedimentorum]MCP8687740.1 phage tail tape measure protein [Marinobacterium sedimentorum]